MLHIYAQDIILKVEIIYIALMVTNVIIQRVDVWYV